ncbi:hypothetical protein O1L55_27530 [Streptomyces albulus]|nr:hypothetical protein [Streptomyces noursei]
MIRYTLVNRGNTGLRPQVAVRADGLFGTLLRRPARLLPDVLPPGARTARTETWSDPPALDAVDVTLTATAAGGRRTPAPPHTPPSLGTGVAVALLLAAGGASGRSVGAAGAAGGRRRPATAGPVLTRRRGGPRRTGPVPGRPPAPDRRTAPDARAAATTTTGTTSSTTTVAKTGSGCAGERRER